MELTILQSNCVIKCHRILNTICDLTDQSLQCMKKKVKYHGLKEQNDKIKL